MEIRDKTLVEEPFSPLTVEDLYNSPKGLKSSGRQTSTDWGSVIADLFEADSGHDTSSGIASDIFSSVEDLKKCSSWIKKCINSTQIFGDRSIHQLPTYLLSYIFSFLDSKQLVKCSMVCKTWKKAANAPSLKTRIILHGENTRADQALKSLAGRQCVAIDSSGCKRLTDYGVRHIACKCVELRNLNLRGCKKITSSSVCKILSNCPNLRTLDVSGSLVTHLQLTPSINRSVYLKSVDLSESKVNDVGLEQIGQYCPNIENLYIRKCQLITDKGLCSLVRLCNNIKELSVGECRGIGDASISCLATNTRVNLRYLSICNCPSITDLSLISLANHCHRIRYLNARGCQKITDYGLSILSIGLKSRLKSLDVGNTSISDAGVLELAKHSIKLRRLSLKKCRITDASLIALVIRCPNLRQLNLRQCENISRDAYQSIRLYCKTCVIEHTNPALF